MTDDSTGEASAAMVAAMQQINDNAGRLIAEVGPDQWEAKTPCTEWNVRDLVLHMVNSTRFFQASASRGEPQAPVDAEQLGDDPAAVFGTEAAATMAAWSAPGATDGMVTVPQEMPAVAALGINLLDTGTHCWDLAEAIGSDHGLTEDQVQLIDQCSRQTVTDEIRGHAGFGPNLDDGSATGLSSTLGFLGRRG